LIYCDVLFCRIIRCSYLILHLLSLLYFCVYFLIMVRVISTLCKILLNPFTTIYILNIFLLYNIEINYPYPIHLSFTIFTTLILFHLEVQHLYQTTTDKSSNSDQHPYNHIPLFTINHQLTQITHIWNLTINHQIYIYFYRNPNPIIYHSPIRTHNPYNLYHHTYIHTYFRFLITIPSLYNYLYILYFYNSSDRYHPFLAWEPCWSYSSSYWVYIFMFVRPFVVVYYYLGITLITRQ